MEIKIGDRFFDENHSRYLTVDGAGRDPRCFRCIEEEFTENGELEIVGAVLMMNGELAKMKRG